jgi:hypothetical protein
MVGPVALVAVLAVVGEDRRSDRDPLLPLDEFEPPRAVLDLHADINTPTGLQALEKHGKLHPPFHREPITGPHHETVGPNFEAAPEVRRLLHRTPSPMDWIPTKKVGVCACAKCGTTAIYNAIYEGIFKQEAFKPGGGENNWGFIQKIHDPHWHSLWSARGGPPDFFVSGENFTEPGTHDGWAIAFVREPVSRLISAWKDKMACGLYIPAGQEGKGDGGYFEAANVQKRKENIAYLWKLLGKDDRNPGYTVHSSHCPQNHVSSPHTNTTWNGQCTYQHCLSLPQFVEDLHIVHQKGMQNELNAHIKPQSRVCFKDGATPETWDRVATGYEQAAISELGRHLGAKLNTESDNKHGSSHSTSDAMLDGAPFKVTNSVLNILEHLTQEEDRMLRRFYGHTKSRLMGKELTHYHEEEAGKALADHDALHRKPPEARAMRLKGKPAP